MLSILYESTAGRYRPVSYPDGPITARYRFMYNAYWVFCFRKGDYFCDFLFAFLHTKSFMSRVLLYKERLCSQGNEILSF